MMAKNYRVGIVALVEPLIVRVVGMGIIKWIHAPALIKQDVGRILFYTVLSGAQDCKSTNMRSIQWCPIECAKKTNC